MTVLLKEYLILVLRFSNIFSRINESITSSIAIGERSKNKLCQPNESTNHPDKVGPIAGANPTVIPTKLIAAPRFPQGINIV